jgi:NAD(P)-dependent dehydrogenase (short-subunit alcohol dehydrogenase family)
VTGSTSGLGQALVCDLSKDRKVLIHGRNSDRARETSEMCSDQSARYWIYDLAKIDQIYEDLQHFLQANSLRVNEFIHCAGTVQPSAHRLTTPTKIQNSFAVNVESALAIVSLLLRRAVNGDSLRNVVFVSSIWGQFGSPGHVSYTASKAALEAASRGLAVELAPKIRVNAVALGAIHSPMSARLLADERRIRAISESYPLGLGTPESFVSSVRFLLGSASSWITGHTLVVDGGRTSHMSHPRQSER